MDERTRKLYRETFDKLNFIIVFTLIIVVMVAAEIPTVYLWLETDKAWITDIKRLPPSATTLILVALCYWLVHLTLIRWMYLSRM